MKKEEWFDVSGIHPKTKIPGTFTQVSYDKASTDELVYDEKSLKEIREKSLRKLSKMDEHLKNAKHSLQMAGEEMKLTNSISERIAGRRKSKGSDSSSTYLKLSVESPEEGDERLSDTLKEKSSKFSETDGNKESRRLSFESSFEAIGIESDVFQTKLLSETDGEKESSHSIENSNFKRPNFSRKREIFCSIGNLSEFDIPFWSQKVNTNNNSGESDATSQITKQKDTTKDGPSETELENSKTYVNGTPTKLASKIDQSAVTSIVAKDSYEFKEYGIHDEADMHLYFPRFLPSVLKGENNGNGNNVFTNSYDICNEGQFGKNLERNENSISPYRENNIDSQFLIGNDNNNSSVNLEEEMGEFDDESGFIIKVETENGGQPADPEEKESKKDDHSGHLGTLLQVKKKTSSIMSHSSSMSTVASVISFEKAQRDIHDLVRKHAGMSASSIRPKIPSESEPSGSDRSSTESRKKTRKKKKPSMEPCDTLLRRKLGPGAYNIVMGGFSAKAVENRAAGPGWARQLEVERLAALPHLLHKDQWEENKMLKRKLGPGSYEIKDFIELSNTKPTSERGICDNLGPRFERTVQSNTPGPGTYGMGGVPQRALEDKATKSASTKGLLDAGDRKRNLPSVGSHLGPGTYRHKTCTDELINKVTSLKGPYKLYSGDRNKPISEGYLAAPKLADLGPGQYEIGSFVDELHAPNKASHGKFGKMAQYPDVPTDRIFLFSKAHYPKMKGAPGPGAYSVQNLSKPQSVGSPGFLSSAKRDDKISQKFFTRNFNPVGAGRYDIQKYEEAQDINGHTSVFKSKSEKPKLQMSKFLQERIRAKDVSVANRTFLSEPPKMTRSVTCM